MTTVDDIGTERYRSAGCGQHDSVEHFDVLVVGAGISGIGVAYHLAHRLPGKRFAVLESRETFGGTWTVNRYPGARSDSDMFTFGYSFKPWLKDELATAEQIRAYLREVINENNLGPYIRYRQRVTSASWSSGTRQWTVEVTRLDTGARLRYTADFVWMCQGYYRQDAGYTPKWPGMEQFSGQIVHPLTRPEDLDYAGKRVLVIGSGATAATLVPAMAESGAGHVTMLQRSPSYYFITPKSNEVAEMLRSVDTPPEWTHEIVRRLIFKRTQEMTEKRQMAPEVLRQWSIDQVRQALPDGYDVGTHFTPTYPLWKQRACRVPEGDLITDLVCRLLEHMGERGATVVAPVLRDGEEDMPLRPWTDPDDFNPGYLMRSIDRVPRQGDRLPWRGTDPGYLEEREILPAADFEDGTLSFK